MYILDSPLNGQFSQCEFAKNNNFVSSFKLDLLTIIIGPEHHDLPFDVTLKCNDEETLKESKIETISRLSFNIFSYHYEQIEIKISRFNLHLKHFLNNNEMALNFNLYDFQTHQLIESIKTKDIKAVKLEKQYSCSLMNNYFGSESIFDWVESDEEKLSVTKKFCWTDLKKSYMSIYINETKYLAESKFGIPPTKRFSILSSNRYDNKPINTQKSNLDYFDLEEREEKSSSSDTNSSGKDSYEDCNASLSEIDEDTNKKYTNIELVYRKNKLQDLLENTKTVSNRMIAYVNESKSNQEVFVKFKKDKKAKFSDKENVLESENSFFDSNKSYRLSSDNLAVRNYVNEKDSYFRNHQNSFSNHDMAHCKTEIFHPNFFKKNNSSYNTNIENSINNAKKEHSMMNKAIKASTFILGEDESNYYYNISKQYHKHGVVEIHFNEILEEKDVEITKQSSKLFESFSTFCKPKTKTQEEEDLMHKEVEVDIQKQGNLVKVASKNFSMGLANNVIVLKKQKDQSTHSNNDLNDFLKFNLENRRNTLNLDLKNNLAKFYSSYLQRNTITHNQYSSNKLLKNLSNNSNKVTLKSTKDAIFIEPKKIDLRKKSSTNLAYYKMPTYSKANSNPNNINKENEIEKSHDIDVIQEEDKTVFSGPDKWSSEANKSKIYYRKDSILGDLQSNNEDLSKEKLSHNNRNISHFKSNKSKNSNDNFNIVSSPKNSETIITKDKKEESNNFQIIEADQNNKYYTSVIPYLKSNNENNNYNNLNKEGTGLQKSPTLELNKDSSKLKTMQRRLTTQFLTRINIDNYENIFDKNIKVYKINKNNKKSFTQIKDNKDNSSGKISQSKSASIFVSVYGYYKKELIDNVYYKGEVIGTIELELCIKHIPMIKQIQCGVHTERGFEISSIYLVPRFTKVLSHNSLDGPREISEINNICNIIIHRLSENLELRTIFSQRENNKEIKTKLKRLEQLLVVSVKESTALYEYNSYFEILFAQDLMIKFVKKMLKFIDSVGLEIKNLILSVIELICNRGELDLNMMILENEFSEEIIEQLNNHQETQCITYKDNLRSVNTNTTDKALHKLSNCSEESYVSENKRKISIYDSNSKNSSEEKINYIKLKVKTACSFVEMSIQLLEFCLQNIPRKVHDESTKNFNEFVLSFAYFKFVSFQEVFLNAISNDFSYSTDSFKNAQIPKPPSNQNLNYNDYLSSNTNVGYINNGVLDRNSIPRTNFNNTPPFLQNDNDKPTVKDSNLLQNDLYAHVKEMTSLIEERDGQRNTINPVITIINWDLLFFQRYKKFNDFNFELKQKKLNNLLETNTEWKEKLKKRGVAFYSIVLNLKNYIKKKVVASRNIRWRDIPGFSLILDCVYYDLSTKFVKQISSPCINLMKSFINDSRIMNNFIFILISKTNAYDIDSVIKIFDILHIFFHEYEINKSISSFKFKVDYNLIQKAITIVLNNESYLCITKVIWFLYHNLHIMNLDPLSKILKYIFTEKFYFLFFHWSYQVRNFFYYFLIFIINHKLKLNIDNCFGIEGNEEIIGRRRQILLEKVMQKDDKGFLCAVKKDYLQQIRIGIMNDFYAKLRVIILMISQIKKFKKKMSGEIQKEIFIDSIKDFSQLRSSKRLSDISVSNKNPFIDAVLEEDKILNTDSDKDTLNNKTVCNVNTKTRLVSISPIKKIKLPKIRKLSTDMKYDDSKSYDLALVHKNVSFLEMKSRYFYEEELFDYIIKIKEVSKELKGENTDYLIVGIEQYINMEEQFKIWEKQSKTSDNFIYPAIEVYRVKDDVFEVSNDE